MPRRLAFTDRCEFCTLATFIDPSVYCDITGYFGIDGGGKMKSIGTIEAGTGLWHDPNTGANNSSGFTAFPGGVRFDDAVFNYREMWSVSNLHLRCYQPPIGYGI